MKFKINKKIRILLSSLAVILLACFTLLVKFSASIDNKKILTSSTLMEVLQVAELSTAKFTYNGIADVYKDSENKKLKYHVSYESDVKVGVNMEDIDIDIDEEQKKVFVKLPEIKILTTDVDKNMKFLPEGKDWDIKEAYTACELDAEIEAKEAGELFNVAKTNLRNMIEALTSPIVSYYEYELVWD